MTQPGRGKRWNSTGNNCLSAEVLHCVQITLTLSGPPHPQNFCQFKTARHTKSHKAAKDPETEENERLEPLELSDSHVTDREVPAGIYADKWLLCDVVKEKEHPPMKK